MMLHTRNDRPFWVSTLVKIAQPVLSTLAEGKLRERMPVETREGFREERARFTHLEDLSRSLAGIGPWLNLAGLEGEEEDTRRTRKPHSNKQFRHSSHAPGYSGCRFHGDG